MNHPDPARGQDDEDAPAFDPEVIQRVADALAGTESGQAPEISLDHQAAAAAPSLPQRGA
jgi:hypothetical protein